MFEVGQRIHVEGPFEAFSGTVIEATSKRLRVLIDRSDWQGGQTIIVPLWMVSADVRVSTIH